MSAEPWSPRFTTAARAVAETARRLGLEPPGFRSPPNVPGADRTLKRLPDGRCVVAVRARGRTLDAVIDDLIEGVLAANDLDADDAARVRTTLRRSVAAVPPVGFEPTLKRF